MDTDSDLTTKTPRHEEKTSGSSLIPGPQSLIASGEHNDA